MNKGDFPRHAPQIPDEATRWELVQHVEALSGNLATEDAMPVIGYLSIESPGTLADRVAPFQKGLAEAGFVEGRNVNDPMPLS